jgi:P27 family predicted phage terminase small subunit
MAQTKTTTKKTTKKPVTPKPPVGLGAEANREWRRIVPLLLAMGVVRPRLDRAILSAYCVAWSNWVRAVRQISENGMVETSKRSGLHRISPWQRIADQAAAEMLVLAQSLSMTPAARRRLQIDDGPILDAGNNEFFSA